jgi:hypothetical protein
MRFKPIVLAIAAASSLLAWDGTTPKNAPAATSPDAPNTVSGNTIARNHFSAKSLFVSGGDAICSG